MSTLTSLHLDLPPNSHVAGLHIWNYNGVARTDFGWKKISVLADSATYCGTFVVRRAPGHTCYDFRQLLLLSQPAMLLKEQAPKQQQQHEIEFIFDEPFELGAVKVENYRRAPTARGVKDWELLVDDLLVYQGVLRKDGTEAVLFVEDPASLSSRCTEIENKMNLGAELLELVFLPTEADLVEWICTDEDAESGFVEDGGTTAASAAAPSGKALHLQGDVVVGQASLGLGRPKTSMSKLVSCREKRD
eukprot:g3441.t1